MSQHLPFFVRSATQSCSDAEPVDYLARRPKK